MSTPPNHSATDTPHRCVHGWTTATDYRLTNDPSRCACCGSAPGGPDCGCHEPGECVHCGRFLDAGTWTAGDYGPACARCLARRAQPRHLIGFC